jgi:hypothetical protein
MQISKISKVAGVGFISFWVGIAWGLLHEYIYPYHHPPLSITFDREYYRPASVLSRIGLLAFVVFTVFGISRWVYRRISGFPSTNI